MSTFTGNELPNGKTASVTYNPRQLDVAQWISVARDAGMKYALLTTKHVAGHCLWNTRHNSYNVSNSGNRTDVVEAFVDECNKKGVKPALYYCSWDNHNRFGSKTPSDEYQGKRSNMLYFPKEQSDDLPPYTTSLYHNFQTAQITELMTQFGEIMELWIDIPGVLGKGYRTYLYQHINTLNPRTIVMMNSGLSVEYIPDKAFPSDIRAYERNLPGNHSSWQNIYGEDYYLPGEFCQPIGKNWFFVEGDKPRSKEELFKEYSFCQSNRINYLLNVPPDKRGLIPKEYIDRLTELTKML
jgi:alpha-L-fucosidase